MKAFQHKQFEGLINHNAMRAFVYISVTVWARGSQKWRQLLRKVTEKHKQKRALHCG
jgi:hypothetical protein